MAYGDPRAIGRYRRGTARPEPRAGGEGTRAPLLPRDGAAAAWAFLGAAVPRSRDGSAPAQLRAQIASRGNGDPGPGGVGKQAGASSLAMLGTG